MFPVIQGSFRALQVGSPYYNSPTIAVGRDEQASLEAQNVRPAVRLDESTVDPVEARTAGCFDRYCYCQNSSKKKAVDCCINEVTITCGYGICFSGAVASSIAAISTPAFSSLAICAGSSTLGLVGLMQDGNYLKVKERVYTCCGIVRES
ncbi:MAG: hypothetical protein JSS09_04795 [Verrucomicrobia bacterium]|nr:hypothetical protein [Verrucomicrobiota bacterium]